jgi:hypothetical protein
MIVFWLFSFQIFKVIIVTVTFMTEFRSGRNTLIVNIVKQNLIDDDQDNSIALYSGTSFSFYVSLCDGRGDEV